MYKYCGNFSLIAQFLVQKSIFPFSEIFIVGSKIDKVPRGIQFEKSSNTRQVRETLSQHWSISKSQKGGTEPGVWKAIAFYTGMPHPLQMLHRHLS